MPAWYIIRNLPVNVMNTLPTCVWRLIPRNISQMRETESYSSLLPYYVIKFTTVRSIAPFITIINQNFKLVYTHFLLAASLLPIFGHIAIFSSFQVLLILINSREEYEGMIITIVFSLLNDADPFAAHCLVSDATRREHYRSS